MFFPVFVDPPSWPPRPPLDEWFELRRRSGIQGDQSLPPDRLLPAQIERGRRVFPSCGRDLLLGSTLERPGGARVTASGSSFPGLRASSSAHAAPTDPVVSGSSTLSEAIARPFGGGGLSAPPAGGWLQASVCKDTRGVSHRNGSARPIIEGRWLPLLPRCTIIDGRLTIAGRGWLLARAS